MISRSDARIVTQEFFVVSKDLSVVLLLQKKREKSLEVVVVCFVVGKPVEKGLPGQVRAFPKSVKLGEEEATLLVAGGLDQA